MKHSELSKFTHAELASFTHEELAMFPADILKKIHEDDRPLPVSVIERIQSLCDVLPSDAPHPSNLKSFTDALNFVTAIGKYLLLLPKLSKELSPFLEPIIEDIIDFFN